MNANTTFEHDSETASRMIQFGITPAPELTPDEEEQLYSEEHYKQVIAIEFSMPEMLNEMEF
jgi:hypothetical protein